MKKVLAVFLCFLMILPLIISCDKTNTPSNTDAITDAGNAETEIETDPDFISQGKLTIKGTDISEYVIVISSEPVDIAKNFAEDLSSWIKEMTGITVPIVSDANHSNGKAIIVGDTTRPESAEAKGTGFAKDKDYNAILKEGSIAVNFKHQKGSTSALNALKRAFVNNRGNITEGFANTSIGLESVKGLISGAIRKEITSDGLHVYKSTQAQLDAWQTHEATWNGNKEKPLTATGIQFDVETDSSYIDLKFSGTYSPMVLFLNNELVSTSWVGGYWKLPDDAIGKTNRITVLMSNAGYTSKWAIKSLEIDGGCKIERHKTDLNMLILGDSITEGINNEGHPEDAYTFQLSTYFNAHALVQGNGAGELWPDMIDPEMKNLFMPDVIIIALGTNDYRNNKGENDKWFENRMDAYLDKLESVYPGVPVIGVTPLRRLRSLNSTNTEVNYDKYCVQVVNGGIAKALQNHNAKVVQGENILSETKHYKDLVHPNRLGHKLYGETLCKLIEQDIKNIINKNK